jgi:hypothetical protein
MADTPVTSAGTTGWNTETLKVYVDALRASDDARYTERFQTKQRADDQQAHDLALWRANANEFRGTLSDQAAHFVTRDTMQALVSGLEAKIAATDAKIESVDKRVTANEGRGQGQGTIIGYIVGLAGVAVAILSHLWK